MSVLDIIDFHSHHIAGHWHLTTATSGSAADQARWTRINQDLTDRDALLADIHSGDLAGRVINSPTAFIEIGDGQFPPDAPQRLNDDLAALVATAPDRLFGLASVDSFGGEAAADELVRAIQQLGLRGVFLASARGDALIDAPEARPVLIAAAELGVPVFLHPINPQPLSSQLAPYGRLGTLLARGTVNSAALVALIASGVLDSLPDLNVVVTTLALGGILLAKGLDEDPRGRTPAAELLKRQIYVDTMGFDPGLIRASIDAVGVDHVLAGSDWPIVSTGPIRPRLLRALDEAGVSLPDRSKIASINAARLLRLVRQQ